MKKTYMTPQIKTQVAFEEILQAVSGVKGKVDGSVDIGTGGTDTDGSLDPAANGYGLKWDNDTWDKF